MPVVLAGALLLLLLTPVVRAEDVITTVPTAPGAGTAVTDAQLLRRVELLLERSEAERRRQEGEMLMREHELRAGYEARVQELERQLAAGGAPATSAEPAAEQELAGLRRQMADREQELAELRRQVAAVRAAAVPQPAAAGPAMTALREENEKIASELQRVMLLPPWPPEAVVVELGSAGVLNVNQASREQLLVVPGLTAAGADFIIWYRDRVGPFLGVAELRLVPDVTPEVFSQWRRLLRVE